MDAGLDRLRDLQEISKTRPRATLFRAASNFSGFVSVDVHDVVGEKKRSPMISYYAAGVGVMFLLFTASARRRAACSTSPNPAPSTASSPRASP